MLPYIAIIIVSAVMYTLVCESHCSTMLNADTAKFKVHCVNMTTFSKAESSLRKSKTPHTKQKQLVSVFLHLFVTIRGCRPGHTRAKPG